MMVPTNQFHHNAPAIILFTTMNEDYPIGQYWPSQKFHTEQGCTHNPSSAFIETDDWYSNVTESNVELIDDRANYIGFYTDYETNLPIYLYGIQDEQPNSDEEADDDSDE